MKTITRYIAWRILRGVLLAFVVVTGIIMMVDFVETSRNIGADHDLGSGKILALTVLKTPNLIEETIPFVILFGVMSALYGLNRKSELTVMRASGLSAWRFLRPAIFVTFLVGVLWATVLNPLASNAMGRYADLIEQYTATGSVNKSETEVWLREGDAYKQTVIYAANSNVYKRALYDVTFTIFEADTSGDLIFKERYDAKEAILLESNYWQLTDITENTAKAQTKFSKSMSRPTTITVKQLRDHGNQGSLPSFWKLPGEIQSLNRAGFSTMSHEIKWNKLLALPLTLIAMTVIGAAVSMRLTREGGTLRLLLTGGVIGFAVYFISNIIVAFGEAGSISIPLAVWAIPIFVLCCATAYLSRIEDG